MVAPKNKMFFGTKYEVMEGKILDDTVREGNNKNTITKERNILVKDNFNERYDNLGNDIYSDFDKEE